MASLRPRACSVCLFDLTALHHDHIHESTRSKSKHGAEYVCPVCQNDSVSASPDTDQRSVSIVYLFTLTPLESVKMSPYIQRQCTRILVHKRVGNFLFGGCLYYVTSGSPSVGYDGET